jgi:hypothetical protein
MSAYLDKLLDRVGERVAERVVERLEATLDVLSDRELLDDLKRADQQPDEEAVPLDAVRRARTS